MQELLLHVFQTIEQANIRYCVLRGYEELDEIEDGGDVDLLVQADQLDHFREALARLEFVMLPVWVVMAIICPCPWIRFAIWSI